jgi:alkylation response protein AidB-like acyl-CoA dehydrogenase
MIRTADPQLTELVDVARALAPAIAKHRDETDRLGRTPPDMVRALTEARVFRLWLPAQFDGCEADPATFFDVIETLAAADGSTGWNAMNGACCSLMSYYVPADVGREIYGAPDAIVAGQISFNGKAAPVDGGYRVSGRWSFGSGISQAQWVVAGCMVDAPNDDNTPPTRIHVMLPAEHVQVDASSWQVSGLRGTGSYDYTIDNRFVPAERAFTFFVSKTYHAGPLALLPRSIFAAAIGAVTIGIARGAVDAFVELAATRKAPTTSVLMREHPSAQLAVAHASALVNAARALLREASMDVWDACVRGVAPPVESRLKLRGATVLVPQLCAQAVDLIWRAAGPAAIRESGVIERCFRDIHAATQHLGVSEPMLVDTGRALLGLDPQLVPF